MKATEGIYFLPDSEHRKLTDYFVFNF